ncbi:proton-conducting transporter transmembrane domain-containing protein [Candidatus Orientia mediorientalis]|nr:proton-conducting transporter membrane subunit [Candidatus Orientia mediorientalis]
MPFTIITAIGIWNLIIPFLVHKSFTKELLMLAITVLHAINAILLYFKYQAGHECYTTFFSICDFDFSLRLSLLGSNILLLIAILWPISIIYTIGFLKAHNEPNQNKFLLCTNLCILISNYIVCSANFFTMLICYELLTFATIPLIRHVISHRTNKVLHKYTQRLYLPSLLFLIPTLIVLQYQYHTTDFVEIYSILQSHTSSINSILVLCILCGTAKAAIVPFHGWLPPAMIAPYPVSAILHAVAVVNVGIFCLLTSIFSVLAQETLLLNYVQYFIACGIVYTSLKAIFQTNIKRILAYSTISNLGLIVLSAFMNSNESLFAAISHITAHSIGKITVFYSAGSLYTISKCTDIKDLISMYYKAPITTLCLTIGSLSLIGIPPLAGFFSKHHIILEAANEHNYLVIAITIFSGITSCLYLAKIIKTSYSNVDSECNNINNCINLEQSIPKHMLYSTILCALLVILIPIINAFIM